MKEELSSLEDQLLVMDAQDGDSKAMEKLVLRWQKRLWRHAFRLTANSDAAWDITQESWHGIIRGLKDLNDPANFKAWAYRITTNKSLDWIRTAAASPGKQALSLDTLPAKDGSELDMKELLDRLSTAKKVVLSLYYFEGLTIPEISLALGVPMRETN